MKTLRLLHDVETLDRLGITFESQTREGSDDYWLESERNVIQTFFKFLVHLSAYRAWSQMQFSMMLPQALACVHHENMNARRNGMRRIRNFVEVVLAVEGRVYHGRPSPLNTRVKGRVITLLKSLSWNALQLAREGMAVCQQCHFDPADEELRLFTFSLFGRIANTKFFLEDVFNHVADISRRHAKNHVMQRCFGSRICRYDDVVCLFSPRYLQWLPGCNCFFSCVRPPLLKKEPSNCLALPEVDEAILHPRNTSRPDVQVATGEGLCFRFHQEYDKGSYESQECVPKAVHYESAKITRNVEAAVDTQEPHRQVQECRDTVQSAVCSSNSVASGTPFPP